MNRIVRAAGITAASCALIVGGAGVAAASVQDGGKAQTQTKATKAVKVAKVVKVAKPKTRTKNNGNGKNGRHGGGDHGAYAKGVAVGSPGFISGNVVQVPIHVPINVCGNTVDGFIALLNPAFGNVCINK